MSRANALTKKVDSGTASKKTVEHRQPTISAKKDDPQNGVGRDEGLVRRDDVKLVGLDRTSPVAMKARRAVTQWFTELDNRNLPALLSLLSGQKGISLELGEKPVTTGAGFTGWYQGWDQQFVDSQHKPTFESIQQKPDGSVQVTLFMNTVLTPSADPTKQATIPQRQLLELKPDKAGNLKLTRLKFDGIDLSALGGAAPKTPLAPAKPDMFVATTNLSGATAPKTLPTGKLGADFLVEALRKNGYNWVPLNPGASEEVISSALERGKGVKPVLAYQELTALGFAGGVALAGQAKRVAGDKTPTRAAVIAHGAVGLGGMDSFITGFAQQKLPLLVLIGNAGVQEDAMMRHQNPNGKLGEQAVAAGAKQVFTVTHPDQLMEMLSRATQLAESGTPGPVAVIIPQNGVMDTPVTARAKVEEIPWVQSQPQPDPASVEAIGKKLASAKNPVILVGDEIARNGGVDALVKLAEKTGARIIGSMSHELNFPMSHPLWSGSTGHLFGTSAEKVLQDADVVISMGGVDVSTVFPTNTAPYNDTAFVAYVGTDPGAAAAMYRNSIDPVQSDPKAMLEALSADLDKRLTPQQVEASQARAKQVGDSNLQARQQRIEKANLEKQKVPLHAYDVTEAAKEVLEELGLKLGEDVVIFNEGLTRAQAVQDMMQPSAPGGYYDSQGGSLGYAGPMASGYAQAAPGKIVLAFSGDGGFMYTPQWLLTAQEQGLNVKAVVFKDEAYSLLGQAATAQGRSAPDLFSLGGNRQNVKKQAGVDFVMLANALGGVHSERIAGREGLKDAIRRMLQHDGPALLEADTPVVPS